MNRRTEAMCHSERSEESRVHQVNVTEILRYALDDKMIKSFYFDTPTYRIHYFFQSLFISSKVLPLVSGTIFHTKIAAITQITP